MRSRSRVFVLLTRTWTSSAIGMALVLAVRAPHAECATCSHCHAIKGNATCPASVDQSLINSVIIVLVEVTGTPACFNLSWAICSAIGVGLPPASSTHCSLKSISISHCCHYLRPDLDMKSLSLHRQRWWNQTYVSRDACNDLAYFEFRSQKLISGVSDISRGYEPAPRTALAKFSSSNALTMPCLLVRFSYASGAAFWMTSSRRPWAFVSLGNACVNT